MFPFNVGGLFDLLDDDAGNAGASISAPASEAAAVTATPTTGALLGGAQVGRRGPFLAMRDMRREDEEILVIMP